MGDHIHGRDNGGTDSILTHEVRNQSAHTAVIDTSDEEREAGAHQLEHENMIGTMSLGLPVNRRVCLMVAVSMPLRLSHLMSRLGRFAEVWQTRRCVGRFCFNNTHLRHSRLLLQR